MQSGVGVAQPLLQREVFSHLLCLQRSGGKMPLVVPPFFGCNKFYDVCECFTVIVSKRFHNDNSSFGMHLQITESKKK